MKKWNFKTKKYEQYKGPKNAMLYTQDMGAECQCAECGRKMKFGEGFTSSIIHNDFGFGFCICEECKNAEIKEMLKERESAEA